MESLICSRAADWLSSCEIFERIYYQFAFKEDWLDNFNRTFECGCNRFLSVEKERSRSTRKRSRTNVFIFREKLVVGEYKLPLRWWLVIDPQIIYKVIDIDENVPTKAKIRFWKQTVPPPARLESFLRIDLMCLRRASCPYYSIAVYNTDTLATWNLNWAQARVRCPKQDPYGQNLWEYSCVYRSSLDDVLWSWSSNQTSQKVRSWDVKWGAIRWPRFC